MDKYFGMLIAGFIAAGCGALASHVPLAIFGAGVMVSSALLMRR